MKTTISSLLMKNAFESIKRSKSAKNKHKPYDEILNCIGANLMISLTHEGIANEIGEIAFGESEWKRKQMLSTAVKWKIISQFNGRIAFNDSEEPLLTIHHVNKIRNEIVHPKIRSFRHDVIIRSKTSKLVKDSDTNYALQNKDSVLIGFGQLLQDYNYEKTLEIFKRSIKAIKKLKTHLTIHGLEWVNVVEKDLIEKL